MAPHSSTLAWQIPWTEEPGRLQFMGSGKLDTTERLHFHFSLSCIGEGNGNPLQCSCLENPRDGRTWWAAVYGVAQSQTRLKRLSSSSSNRYLFTSYFCIPVPYNEKDIFLECQFWKVLQVFIESFNFSFFNITGWDIDLDYCDVNGLPWKQAEILLSFQRLHPSNVEEAEVE